MAPVGSTTISDCSSGRLTLRMRVVDDEAETGGLAAGPPTAGESDKHPNGWISGTESFLGVGPLLGLLLLVVPLVRLLRLAVTGMVGSSVGSLPRYLLTGNNGALALL